MSTVHTGKAKTFRLGEYSNDPKEYEKEIAERQEAVVREVGEFLIQQTPQYRHWRARTKDGSALPKALEGLWSSPGHFQVAAEKFQAKQTVVSKPRGKNVG